MHLKRHRILTLVLLILCLFLSLFGVVVSISSILNRTTKSGLFEDILISFANIFMVAIALFTMINTIHSFKRGSTFMKELTQDSRKNMKRKSFIIFTLIGLFGLSIFIVFILMYVDVIKNTVFPKALDAAMMSFSFIITTLGFTFMSYPLLSNLDKKENNNELHN